jgi:ankyrin repeat protein
MAAIERDDAGAVERLIARDRSLLAHRNERGESPVLVACYRHKKAALRAILAARPDLTIWEAAATGELTVVVGHLRQNGTSLATYSQDGWTPLHLAAFFGHAGVVAELLRRGAQVDASSRNTLANQPLHAAAAGGSVEVCRMLVDAGADVNARQHGAYSPLHEAAHSGNQPLVELLLDNGADRSARTASGETPALLAEKAGHELVASLLR